MHATQTTAGCTCGTCSTQALQRPRFFARQLVTPAELNLGTDYVLARVRSHNRLLHGWGVVCGAQVCRVPGTDGGEAQPWKVKIRPGYLIDGCGNEVQIDCERIVDLRVGVTVATCGDPPGEVSDPWCSDVWTERDGGRVWVAVCYAQRRGRPVRTQPTGCGCDDSSCEYSRWLDGYEVRLLDQCPPSHKGPPPTREEIAATLSGPLPDCPPCPDDPCVVLAAVDFDADGAVTAIDNCSCRRMVLSTAAFWWRCGGVVTISAVAATTDGPFTPGATGVVLHVEGVNLRDDVTVDLGPGVTVQQLALDGNGNLDVTVDLADDATPGDRALTITTNDCSTATWADALTISAPPKAGAQKSTRKK
jgi:hypothetical protein